MFPSSPLPLLYLFTFKCGKIDHLTCIFWTSAKFCIYNNRVFFIYPDTCLHWKFCTYFKTLCSKINAVNNEITSYENVIFASVFPVKTFVSKSSHYEEEDKAYNVAWNRAENVLCVRVNASLNYIWKLLIIHNQRSYGQIFKDKYSMNNARLCFMIWLHYWNA